jgi:hypothetical protein
LKKGSVICENTVEVLKGGEINWYLKDIGALCIDELFLGWMNLVATTKLQVKRFIKLVHISRNTLFICWHTGVVLFIAVVKEI